MATLNFLTGYGGVADSSGPANGTANDAALATMIAAAADGDTLYFPAGVGGLGYKFTCASLQTYSGKALKFLGDGKGVGGTVLYLGPTADNKDWLYAQSGTKDVTFEQIRVYGNRRPGLRGVVKNAGSGKIVCRFATFDELGNESLKTEGNTGGMDLEDSEFESDKTCILVTAQAGEQPAYFRAHRCDFGADAGNLYAAEHAIYLPKACEIDVKDVDILTASLSGGIGITISGVGATTVAASVPTLDDVRWAAGMGYCLAAHGTRELLVKDSVMNIRAVALNAFNTAGAYFLRCSFLTTSGAPDKTLFGDFGATRARFKDCIIDGYWAGYAFNISFASKVEFSGGSITNRDSSGAGWVRLNSAGAELTLHATEIVQSDATFGHGPINGGRLRLIDCVNSTQRKFVLTAQLEEVFFEAIDCLSDIEPMFTVTPGQVYRTVALEFSREQNVSWGR